MKTSKAIEKRTSSRNFLKKKVAQKLINKIISAGGGAPSAKNTQPWLFVELNDEQKTACVKELIKEANKLDFQPRSFLLATAEAINQAPVLILVFATIDDEFFHNSYILSIGAAIENCLLQATELGIQSLWNCDMLAIDKSFFKKLLNIDYNLVSGISLGYNPNVMKAHIKKPISEIFINNNVNNK